MKLALRSIMVGLLAIAASPASAADWWLVSGVPNEPVAIFADTASLVRHGHSAQIQVLRIDRSGRSFGSLQQIQCDTHSGSAEGEVVRTFACASDKDRDRYGLIVAAMGPLQMARVVFATDAPRTAQLASEPRT